LSVRNFIAGTLLSLIFVLAFQGAPPAGLCLSGLEGVSSASLVPVGPGKTDCGDALVSLRTTESLCAVTEAAVSREAQEVGSSASGAGADANGAASAAPPAASGGLSGEEAVAALFPAGHYYAEVLAEGGGSAGGAPGEASVEDGSPAPAASEASAGDESAGSAPAPEPAALEPAPGSEAEPAPGTAPDPAAEPGPAPAPADADGPAEDPAEDSSGTVIAGFMNYTVQPGDDLSSLARRFGTTPEVIASESGIPVTQTLYPGMSLRVPTTDPAEVEPRGGAVAVPWSEVNAMWEVGTVAQVTDVWTGNIFYVMRRGGWAHADVEPVSHRDTAVMLANYGGQWSWARRPIVVVIDGRRIAASQNGMPHGGSSLDNGFPGHFCIHFLGSTTHGSSYTSNGVPTLDPAHQRCVQEAVGH